MYIFAFGSSIRTFDGIIVPNVEISFIRQIHVGVLVVSFCVSSTEDTLTSVHITSPHVLTILDEFEFPENLIPFNV